MRGQSPRQVEGNLICVNTWEEMRTEVRVYLEPSLPDRACLCVPRPTSG